MPYRPTGIGGFGFSINWEKVPGDEDLAQEVITFLEDRRLLFRRRHMEDEMHCVDSANEMRHFLTGSLFRAKSKSLATSIRAIRAALREFVDAAGPQARNFLFHPGGTETDFFSMSLGELRSRVGLQVALIAYHYGIEVEADLARILPPPLDDEPSFVPGFEDRP